MSIPDKEPVNCNQQVLAHTAQALSEPMSLVKEITSHYFGFIADTIERGAFEGVEVRYFGRFQAKLRYVQTLNMVRMRPMPKKPNITDERPVQT